MGHNRAGVNAKHRRKRRIREEARLQAKQQPQDAAKEKPGLLKRAARAVRGLMKSAVQKVTGGE